MNTILSYKGHFHTYKIYTLNSCLYIKVSEKHILFKNMATEIP